jgi:hypothetical protein
VFTITRATLRRSRRGCLSAGSKFAAARPQSQLASSPDYRSGSRSELNQEILRWRVQRNKHAEWSRAIDAQSVAKRARGDEKVGKCSKMLQNAPDAQP